jgi:hypothetical protein
MRMINDERAVTVTLETILLFTITVMMLGMVMISFQSINERASETVMGEQYTSIGNDVATKIVDMDVEIKASLLEDSVIDVRKEINLPSLIADKPYEVEVSTGQVTVTSASSPYVSVIVPLDPDVNVADGSKVHSMVEQHFLIYEHNGQIMFENGGVEAISDEIWPTISILTPNNGALLSDIETVTVLALDNVGISRVEYYIEGSYETTVSNSPYSWEWNTYSTSDGTYTVTAMVYDRAGHYSSDTRTYIVDNGVDGVAPTGEIVSPDNGTITDYNPLLIEAIVRDNIAIDYSSIKIELYNVDNVTLENVTASATITNTSLTEYTIQYLPSTPFYADTYEVKVYAAELFYGAGDPENKNVTLEWNFTIIPITDTTDPTLAITYPLNVGYLLAGENIQVGYDVTDNTAVDDSGIDYLVINVTYNSTNVYTHRENISSYPIVVDSVTSIWQFSELYVEQRSYEYNVTVYDRAGHSNYLELGPFVVPFGQAADLVVDDTDINADSLVVEFNIRSTGPDLDINGLYVEFSDGKLADIYFGGTHWASPDEGKPDASVNFANYRVPITDTPVKLVFSKPIPTLDPPTFVTLYFFDGTSKDIYVIHNP